MPPRRAALQSLTRPQSVDDDAFDIIWPATATRHSERHWTPVDTARQGARLLCGGQQLRVLDVGSGVGKFCIVGALTTRSHFTGIEQRLHLCQTARAVANEHGIERVRFLHGNAGNLDWSAFEAFYLFNPFQEHLNPYDDPIDDTIPLAEHRFHAYVRMTYGKLMSLPPGVRVLTYHGYGGRFPPDYACVARERSGTDFVTVWTKVAP